MIEIFDPLYTFPHGAKEKINELIQASNRQEAAIKALASFVGSGEWASCEEVVSKILLNGFYFNTLASKIKTGKRFTRGIY